MVPESDGTKEASFFSSLSVDEREFIEASVNRTATENPKKEFLWSYGQREESRIFSLCRQAHVFGTIQI